MTNRSRFRRGGTVVAAAAAAAAPGVALAATPVKGGFYYGTKLELIVSRTGKSLKMEGVTYCSKYRGWKIKNISIRHGRFSFTGSTSHPSGVHAVARGHFVSRSKATGTVKIGSCSKTSFTAKRSQGY